MSPRAACRLERLGFADVYDYVAGKMDWLSFALPHQGEALLAGDVARPEVPTCGPGEAVGELQAHLAQAGAGFCLVTSPGGVVLGVVQDRLGRVRRDATAEEVMDFGITTVRPGKEAAPSSSGCAPPGWKRSCSPAPTAPSTACSGAMGWLIAGRVARGIARGRSPQSARPRWSTSNPTEMSGGPRRWPRLLSSQASPSVQWSTACSCATHPGRTTSCTWRFWPS